MRQRDLEILGGLRSGELAAAVVVVDDEIAVERAADAAPALLAAVRRRVAEEAATQVHEVDVRLGAPPSPAPVGLRGPPAQSGVLDREDVLGNALVQLDVVGDPVAVGTAVRVGEWRGVAPPLDPVHTEVRGAGGGSGRLRRRVGAALGIVAAGWPGEDTVGPPLLGSAQRGV